MSWRARPRWAMSTIWSRSRSLRSSVERNMASRRSASAGGNWMRITGNPPTGRATYGWRVGHLQRVHVLVAGAGAVAAAESAGLLLAGLGLVDGQGAALVHG